MTRLLALIALCWMSIASAHAQWFEATTPRVRVLAKGDADTARELAEKLERFDAAMRLIGGVESRDMGPAGRLTVYVVDPRDLSRYAGSDMVAGFYSPRAGGSVAFVPRTRGSDRFALNAEAVLLHEYAHHFMFRNYPGAYPAWLTEGYAEFYATAQFGRDGSIQIGHPPLYRAQGLLDGPQLPIDRLLEPGDRSMQAEQMDNLYGRGWLLTHLLTFSDERKGQLRAYLAALQAGTSSVDAARTAFGDLAVLDREMNRYMNRRLTGLRLTADRLAIPAVALRQLTPAQSAMMDVHVESDSGVSRQEALALLPKARRVSAQHPDDAFVQGALAEAEYDAGNYAQSRDAAIRAIAIDADSRQGLLYHGMALAALAREAKDRERTTYRAVIAPWIRANRLDPDDPRPMMLIHRAAVEFGQYADSIAKGILYAQQIAPEDRGLRMTAAMEHVRAGNLRAARPLIASLAYDRHAGNRERMAELLRKIDSGDASAARAVLSAPGGSAGDAEDESAGDD